MTIGTIRLNQQNAELFSELNKKLETVQGQVGSGKAKLTLSENLHDISKLSAAEEKKSETIQFIKNSQRAKQDLEGLDIAFDRLQNLTIRFQELAVESANGTMSSKDRERYIVEAKMIKDEFFDVANQNDSFGNALFGGISGLAQPFSQNPNGTISYNGSSIEKSVKISNNLSVQQNFSGNVVFTNIKGQNENFSLFSIIDDFVSSLQVSLNSDNSSNILSAGNSVDLVLPDTGMQSEFNMTLSSDGENHKISTTIFGNDYKKLVDYLNSSSGPSNITAAVVNGNRIRLTDNTSDNLTISNFEISNFDPDASKVSIIKDITSDTVSETITTSRLKSATVRSKITEVFEHFSTKRAEVGAAARRADENEIAMQDVLVTMEEAISGIKDADLAKLLTQLEFLMTNKEAAQATFTRITSKSLFDFLG